MLDQNEVFRLLRAGQARELHRQLDDLSSNADGDLRCSIAHWRTSALVHEKKYSEALDHLAASKADYGCRSLAHRKKATILDVLGRVEDATAEMSSAPLASEAHTHPELVLDAKFYLIYLMAKSGRSVPTSDLSGIPDDYTSVVPDGDRLYGAHVSKDDLIAKFGAGAVCGCGDS